MPRISASCFRLRLRQVLFSAPATFLLSLWVGFFLSQESTFWYLISCLRCQFHYTFRLRWRDVSRSAYPDGDHNTYYHTPRSLSWKYTSEGYFFKNIRESRFLTNHPEKAHLLFIPISCHKMRGKGLSYENMTSIVQEYVESLIIKYPFWNRTLGADHFFVTCHDIGLNVAARVPHLVKNSIRVVCSPRDDDGYIPHKDFPLPQIIQPFSLPAARFDPKNRTTLGFWSGNSNSKLKRQLVSAWKNDTELDIQSKRINNATGKFPHLDTFNTAKFCICPGWSKVHGSRIALSIHLGCVPLISSDHYDLPFNDIHDWRKFSIIVKEDDIRQLKRILKRIPYGKFRFLHYKTVQVQGHLKWNSPSIENDAFPMVMYQLWLRRHVSKYWFDCAAI